MNTLFETVWNRHVVADYGEGFQLLHVDRHVVPDLNGNCFAQLDARGLTVARPDLTFATQDHSVSTDPNGSDRAQVHNPFVIALRTGAAKAGITHFDVGELGSGSCT